MRMKSIWLIVFSLLVVGVSGCLGQNPGYGSSQTPPQAASPQADFTIVSPKDGEIVTGDSMTLILEPMNVNIVPAGGRVKADEGHFHLTLDDAGYRPVYETSYTYNGLSPGEHTIKVELEKNDHSLTLVKRVTFVVEATAGEPEMAVESNLPAQSHSDEPAHSH